jgi:hypothetical protein
MRNLKVINLQKTGIMTKEELIELINSWENLPYLVNEIARKPEYYSLLMDIALYNSYQKSWRAAYLVDKINDEYPELLKPFLIKMIEQLKIEKSVSKRRHFLKLISMNILPQDQQGFIFDFCLKTFTSAKEPVAVRVHAMQILYNISESEPELKPEILAIIENEMEYHSSAGIISRGSKLANKLRKQKN